MGCGSEDFDPEQRGPRGGSEGGAARPPARIADHFVKVWEAARPGRRIPAARREVRMRHGGLCAVPGGSRPATHEHHIRSRSRGGPDEPANRVALCAAHHLHGVHRGYLTVVGRAGERPGWNLRTGEAEPPLETWITEGDDDVRRVRTDPEEVVGTAAGSGDMPLERPDRARRPDLL